MKNDIVPTDGTLIGIFDKSKIDVCKTEISTQVDKIDVSKTGLLAVDEHTTIEDAKITAIDCNLIVEVGCSLVDEVVATFSIDTLSCE